jgi:3-oxoacyl-[acyl-carrier protein] reductase
MSNSKRLAGKTAIVTGASKGIGAAIARAYGAEGASVVVNYASDKAGADKVVADIVSGGGKAISVKADLGKPADVERLFGVAKEAFGSADVLVNNAGIYRFAPIDDVNESEYRAMFDTNVLGPLLASREAAKQFGQRGGSIINVSSVAATSPTPGAVVYSATKGALDTITTVLAAELGPRGIRVNGVSPGPVATEGVKAAGAADSDFFKKAVADTPLGRVGQPDDIAGLAVFLASDDAGWVTGQHINASGGLR